jgi:tRNA U34 5-methylaminomethyl-2-thiouridine-forming methyltransferase MnmC
LNLSKINVFEVGFGTGLNALLSAIYAQEHKVLINYFSIEQFPIDEHIIQKLNYGHFSRSVELYRSINLAPWNVSQEISPFFTINKLNQDLISFDFEMIQCCDIVFFDAFSPSKQPEMWQPGIFRNIFNILNSKGLLVTYTAAGVVKNALREAGFTVKRLKGPPGKHHMLSAEKQ